jgi:hypothetical protein
MIIVNLPMYSWHMDVDRNCCGGTCCETSGCGSQWMRVVEACYFAVHAVIGDGRMAYAVDIAPSVTAIVWEA